MTITTDAQMNGSAIEMAMSAVFYQDGVLEVSENFDSTVLATITLAPDATDQQIHIALEEAFGLAGHFLASSVERSLDL